VTPECTADPTQCSMPPKINDNFGAISWVLDEGNSYYHALEVGIQHRMSHGFELQGSFTWGKSMIPAPQPALATNSRTRLGACLGTI